MEPVVGIFFTSREGRKKELPSLKLKKKNRRKVRYLPRKYG